jgi:prepilin-type N-terminal cleavage/methylation domain-containing protein/prepilin-type processing-associated H-X9-DG protein
MRELKNGFTPTPICIVAKQANAAEKQGCRQILNTLTLGKLVRGFTLVELLVVISIIAMLLAVLMPALSKARAQAKFLVCGTRQKTILTAVNLYMSSNDGKLPPSTQGQEPTTSGGSPMWTIPIRLKYYAATSAATFGRKGLNGGSVIDTLGSYMKSPDFFACPLAPYRVDWQVKYLNQETAFLNGSYYLLWNYLRWKGDGFNPVQGSKDTLICSDFLLWGEPVNAVKQGGSVWISPHPIKGGYESIWKDAIDTSDNNFKIWMLKDAFGNHATRNKKPDMKMNAGYLDGHVKAVSSKTDYTEIDGSAYLPPHR